MTGSESLGRERSFHTEEVVNRAHGHMVFKMDIFMEMYD